MFRAIWRKGRDVAIFVDNAGYFVSGITRDLAKDLFIGGLGFNIPHTPQLNPIEHVNRIPKNHNRRQRLETIVAKGRRDVKKLAKEGWNTMNPLTLM